MSKEISADHRDHASDQTAELTSLVKAGDRQALGLFMERYRDRLARVVRFRMDRRLAGRIDPDDVLQEAFLEAMQRINEFTRDAKMPFFVWLRFITVQKMVALHRHHLNYKLRDVSREVSLGFGRLPGATSADLAAQLLGSLTSPSQAVAQAETRMKLEEALNSMDETDREVLALRHFEQLANSEAAQVLGLSPAAASNRYVRAIKRLKTILDETSSFPGSGT